MQDAGGELSKTHSRAGRGGGVDYRIIYNTTPFISESIARSIASLQGRHHPAPSWCWCSYRTGGGHCATRGPPPVCPVIGTFAVMPRTRLFVNKPVAVGMVLAARPSSWNAAIVVVENVGALAWSKGRAAGREAARRAMDEVTRPGRRGGPGCCAPLFVPFVRSSAA